MKKLLLITCLSLAIGCTKEAEKEPVTTESIEYSIFCKSAKFTFMYKGSDREWHNDTIKQQSYTKKLNVDTRDFQFVTQVQATQILAYDSVSLTARSGSKKVFCSGKYPYGKAASSVQLSQLK